MTKANQRRRDDSAKELPTGRIGKLDISRIICVGMFDFQTAENVIIAKDILNGKLHRKRPFRAQKSKK